MYVHRTQFNIRKCIGCRAEKDRTALAMKYEIYVSQRKLKRNVTFQ